VITAWVTGDAPVAALDYASLLRCAQRGVTFAGVTISLPVAEHAKPRKIDVSVTARESRWRSARSA
jgi:hypothetical protein